MADATRASSPLSGWQPISRGCPRPPLVRILISLSQHSCRLQIRSLCRVPPEDTYFFPFSPCYYQIQAETLRYMENSRRKGCMSLWIILPIHFNYFKHSAAARCEGEQKISLTVRAFVSATTTIVINRFLLVVNDQGEGGGGIYGVIAMLRVRRGQGQAAAVMVVQSSCLLTTGFVALLPPPAIFPITPSLFSS